MTGLYPEPCQICPGNDCIPRAISCDQLHVRCLQRALPIMHNTCMVTNFFHGIVCCAQASAQQQVILVSLITPRRPPCGASCKLRRRLVCGLQSPWPCCRQQQSVGFTLPATAVSTLLWARLPRTRLWTMQPERRCLLTSRKSGLAPCSSEVSGLDFICLMLLFTQEA